MTRRHAAWAALILSVVTLLLACVRVLDGPHTERLPSADRVIVVGIGGLTWGDIDADTTPHLAEAVANGQSGMLTARGAASFACPLDGWATLGAGNRALYREIERTCAEQRATPVDPGVARKANDDLKFGAEVGELGRSVRCTAVYGQSARLAVSDGSGDADVRLHGSASETDPATWVDRSRTCPLTLVAGPNLVRDDLRPERLAAADRLVGGLTDALAQTDNTRLIIAGVSDTPGLAPTMHAAVTLGSDDGSPGILWSSSTGRPAYVQLIDVAPTVLDMLGIDRPSSIAGRPWQVQPDEAPADERVAAFNDATAQADAHRSVTTASFWTWDALVALFVLAAVLLLPRGMPKALKVIGIAIASAPVATLLANAVPWWRADPVWPAYVAAVTAATAIVTTVACWGPWRRLRFGAPVAVAVITVATLALDVATGSVLQLNSTLGYNPIVAGRFTGFGNMPFAVYAVAGLIVMGALVAGRSPRFTYAVGVIGGGTLVAINGAPGVGSDFGGVLALVPATALLTVVAAGHRLTVVRIAAAVGGGVLVVTVVAMLDHLRPPDAQTHLGRFVGQVRDGSAWQIVDRKLDANLNLLLHSPVALLVPVLVVVCWWLLRSARSPGRVLASEHAPALLATYVGVATVALVGTAINDSGIAVLVAAGAVAVPLWLVSVDDPVDRVPQ